MAHDDDGINDSSQAGAVFMGALLTLGGIAALWMFVGVGLFLLKNVLFFGLLGGAGYLGYRMIAGGGKQKAVGGRRSQKALGPGRRGGNSSDDFERKMRELDAIEKRLDAEIGKR